jgi:WD40 repeat protein
MRVLKHPDTVWHLEFSPDGRQLLGGGSLRCVAALPGGEFRPVVPVGELSAAAFAPEPGHLIARQITVPQSIKVIDSATGAVLRQALLEHSVDGFAFGARAALAAAVVRLEPRAVLLWSWPGLEERPGPKVERVERASSAPDYWLRFSPDGRSLAVLGDDLIVEAYDLATGQRRWESTRLGGSPTRYLDTLTFSPDGGLVAVISNTYLTVLDAADGKVVGRQRSGRKRYQGLAFTADGRFLATVSYEGTVKAYDTTDWQPRHELAWEIGELGCVAFSPDGMLGAVGGKKKVVLWDVDW